MTTPTELPGGLLAKRPEQVVVDRDALTTLLQLAEAEVETLSISTADERYVRKRRLDAEVSDAHDTIAAVRKQIADQRRKTPALRKPYFDTFDGVTALQRALNESELKNDGGLLTAITKLTQALDGVRAYMDERYLWD